MVRLEGVRVAFDRGPPALDGVDLTLERGALVALIGPPSSGKSVLLKVIAGLVRPTSGKARIGTLDLVLAPEPELLRARRRVGMVFQNNALFDASTVFENVAFPLRRSLVPPPEAELEARVRARLVEVGLSHAEGLYPHELSGGMQKRVGIARATVASPAVRLFDEPTAGLDPVTSARILRLITGKHDAHPEGVTVIVSSEVDTLLAVVPRVVMLARGRVAWDGSVGAINGAPAVARFVRGEGEAEA